jgi:flagellin-like hook-associated protein FlgL
LNQSNLDSPRGFWRRPANVASLRFSGNEFGNFGVTASDPALRKLVRSIVIAGSVISDKLDPETLKVVSNIALVKAIEAESEITSLRSNLGSSIRRLEAASEKMTLQISLARREISDLVDVDPFELSLRVETLRTRLEASLMTTSRLSKLSLVNFM